MKKLFCQNCVLHSDVPGVEINEKGVCSFCSTYKDTDVYELRLRKVLTKRMEMLFEKVKAQPNMYDAVVLFSGGKDSTYLLKLAKEKYGLKVLAISLIHPIVNETAKKNIEDVVKVIGVDHIGFRIQEEVYINVMKKGILEGEKYGLDEFFGCSICSFFHFWIPIKIAMKMNIPIILEGSDLGQSGNPIFSEGDQVKQSITKGTGPYDNLHKLFNDTLGDEYKNSIYGYDAEEILNGNYPSLLSPFTFLDYDYKEAMNEIENMGLQRSSFNKIYTNCSLIPYLSYFTIKKYDCIPYTKQYANEIRRNYPMLMQLSIDNSHEENILNKETVENLINEYKNVILYIAENKLTKEQILGSEKENIIELAPTYIKLYKEKVSDELISDLSKIPYYSDLFNIDIY